MDIEEMLKLIEKYATTLVAYEEVDKKVKAGKEVLETELVQASTNRNQLLSIQSIIRRKLDEASILDSCELVGRLEAIVSVMISEVSKKYINYTGDVVVNKDYQDTLRLTGQVDQTALLDSNKKSNVDLQAAKEESRKAQIYCSWLRMANENIRIKAREKQM